MCIRDRPNNDHLLHNNHFSESQKGDLCNNLVERVALLIFKRFIPFLATRLRRKYVRLYLTGRVTVTLVWCRLTR